MYQKYIVRGRAYIEPKFRFLENGQAVVNFVIVVNRKNNPSKSDKIPAVAWGGCAKDVNNQIQKGDMAFFEGEIRSSEWKEDGKTQYKQQLEIESFIKEKVNQKDGDKDE